MTVLQVGTAAELQAAWARASWGDHIVLVDDINDGAGPLTVDLVMPPARRGNPAGRLTIRSDGRLTRKFGGRLRFSGGHPANAIVKDIMFRGWNDNIGEKPGIGCLDCSSGRETNVAVTGCLFTTHPQSPEQATGARPTTRWNFGNNDFENLWCGISSRTGTGESTISWNRFRELSDDLMPVGSVRDMLIEYNFGQASRKRHDAPHPDFIQYTLNNVRGRWNIGTIRWNAYLRGEGPEDVVDASGFFIQATPSSSTARLHGRVYGNLYCGGTADGFALDFAEPDLMFENNVILRALSGPNARVPSPCRFPNAYGGVARRNVTNAGFDLSDYNLSETLFNKLLGLSPAEYAEAFVNPQWDTNFASLAEAMQAWAPVEGGPLQNDDGSYSGWMFPADSDGTARINTGRPWVKDQPDRSPGP